MEGFTREALIMLPKNLDYQPAYKALLRKGIDNIITYVRNQDMKVVMFSTDELALDMRLEPDVWVSNVLPEDEFFIKNNCGGIGNIPEDCRKVLDIYKKAKEKFPLKPGLSKEQRFADVLQRQRFISLAIIHEAKMIWSIQKKSNPGLKPNIQNDGNIRIIIDTTSLMCTCYISGTRYTANDFLKFEDSHKPIYDWRINDEGSILCN